MSLISATLKERVRAMARQGVVAPWPAAALRGVHDPGLRALDAALALVERPVQQAILEWLHDADDHGLRGLGALWAVAAARSAGWRESDIAEGRAILVHRDGGTAALLPVAFPLPASRDEQLERLKDQLDSLFVGRRYSLVLRGPLPDDFSPLRLVEPVQMWIRAVERGRWNGDYAIYEDGGVSVEICLHGRMEGSRAEGMVLYVAPARSDAICESVVARVGDALVQLNGRMGDVPVIPVLTRGRPWHLVRSARVQLLYGKLEELNAGGGRTTLSVRGTPAAAFQSAHWDAVSAVWWMAPHRSSPTCPRGRCDENPWFQPGAPSPLFPGRRLAAVLTPEPGDSAVAMMALHKRRKSWEIEP